MKRKIRRIHFPNGLGRLPAEALEVNADGSATLTLERAVDWKSDPRGEAPRVHVVLHLRPYEMAWIAKQCRRAHLIHVERAQMGLTGFDITLKGAQP